MGASIAKRDAVVGKKILPTLVTKVLLASSYAAKRRRGEEATSSAVRPVEQCRCPRPTMASLAAHSSFNSAEQPASSAEESFLVLARN